MTELALFASTFALVFALEMQSPNVNGEHYKAAFVTFGIVSYVGAWPNNWKSSEIMKAIIYDFSKSHYYI